MLVPHIPNPCHKDWNQMTPNEKGRFCASCSKTVVDFTKPDNNSGIENFENVCGRFKRFEPMHITYKKAWYHPFPKLYRKTIIGFLTFISFQFLSASQTKAQTLALNGLDVTERSGTITVNKVPPVSQNLTITGRVMDKTENEPLIFANVAVMQNDSTIAGTVTDIDGNYELTIKRDMLFNDTIDLTVTYLGYEALTMKDIPLLKDYIVLNLSLSQMAIQVMGACIPQFIDPFDNQSKTTIGRDDLRNSPYRP